EGGVLLGVRRRGDAVRIDVVDSGVGIAPDQIEAIFGEFTRLGEVEVEGLGLGLALAERIVRLLGGTIEVRSTPGRGSRFSLTLPALEGPALASASPSTPDRAPTQTRARTVLVVDDDPRIVEASFALLTRLGHRTLVAANATEALAHGTAADAVLIDYRLSDAEDGLTLLRDLRLVRPGLPAALITAEATPEIRRQAAALGVEVFAKPVAASAIERFLARVNV
ncbi:MAG: ATP-binding protein, partial [Sphingomonas sp.]